MLCPAQLLGSLPPIRPAYSGHFPFSLFQFPIRLSLFHFSNPEGVLMTSPTTTGSTSISMKMIGYFVQLGGIAAFAVGAVLSLHHVAIGVAFVGGAVAYYVGEKIRAMA
jgi:hypothetical protein